MILVALMVCLTGLRAGDHWSAERTIHFVSTEAGIDMENDDHFDFMVFSADGKLSMKVERHQTGTRLPDGTFISAPAGPPEGWTLPISDTGELSAAKLPMDYLEQVLTKIVVAAWNGPGVAQVQPLIRVKSVSSGLEQIAYDEAPEHGHAKIEGTATLDPTTHAPVAISLMGHQIHMPGGSDVVSIRVEYKVAATLRGLDRALISRRDGDSSANVEISPRLNSELVGSRRVNLRHSHTSCSLLASLARNAVVCRQNLR